jgi:hypothetical protein
MASRARVSISARVGGVAKDRRESTLAMLASFKIGEKRRHAGQKTRLKAASARYM